MKKLIALTLVFALALCAGFTLASCSDEPVPQSNGEEQEACTHEFGEWTTVKAATCTENGEKTRKCTLCEETETEPITAAHSYVDGVCSVCGNSTIVGGGDNQGGNEGGNENVGGGDNQGGNEGGNENVGGGEGEGEAIANYAYVRDFAAALNGVSGFTFSEPTPEELQQINNNGYLVDATFMLFCVNSGNSEFISAIQSTDEKTIEAAIQDAYEQGEFLEAEICVYYLTDGIIYGTEQMFEILSTGDFDNPENGTTPSNPNPNPNNPNPGGDSDDSDDSDDGDYFAFLLEKTEELCKNGKYKYEVSFESTTNNFLADRAITIEAVSGDNEILFIMEYSNDFYRSIMSQTLESELGESGKVQVRRNCVFAGTKNIFDAFMSNIESAPSLPSEPEEEPNPALSGTYNKIVERWKSLPDGMIVAIKGGEMGIPADVVEATMFMTDDAEYIMFVYQCKDETVYSSIIADIKMDVERSNGTMIYKEMGENVLIFGDAALDYIVP